MIDLISILIVAKVLVMLFEDGVAAWKGEVAPRHRVREQRRKAAERREPTHGDRAKNAAKRYFADLTEDAAEAVLVAHRRRAARRHARRGLGPVLVDFDRHARHWFATCDLCGWTSPARRVEALARDDAKTHAEREHSPDPDPGEETVPSQPAEPLPAKPQSVAPKAEPPRLTVIDGGKPDKPVPLIKPEPEPVATKGNSVNPEAQGPEAIRGALAEGIAWCEAMIAQFNQKTSDLIQNAERFSESVGVLNTAADNYESERMAASTVAHIREAAAMVSDASGRAQDAAESAAAAVTALTATQEALETALADFNARDGQVAEAVADAGNLASEGVLVG